MKKRRRDKRSRRSHTPTLRWIEHSFIQKTSAQCLQRIPKVSHQERDKEAGTFQRLWSSETQQPGSSNQLRIIRTFSMRPSTRWFQLGSALDGAAEEMSGRAESW